MGGLEPPTPCLQIQKANLEAGITNHDDYFYGTGGTRPRGNLTQVQRLVNGSTYLTKTMTYDMTGQMTTETDWNGNTTTYGYSDSFFYDNASGSPATYSPSTSPTNAYVTSIDPPILSASTLGYYFGSGAKKLLEWFESEYCKKRDINEKKVLAAVKNWLRDYRASR